MSWMNTLYRTYEANAAMAGKADEEISLSLVAHMTANAQLEITVDIDGNFLGVTEVPKGSPKKIIPVTEVSASRSNGIAPHALCDMLPYVAGDYSEYVSDSKAAGKADDKFKKYLENLKKWCCSNYSHPKVKAIYSYVSEKKMMSDLINAGIYKCAEEGKISDKKAEKDLVCFRVRGTYPDATWQDETLFDSFTKYYLSCQDSTSDVCYLSGIEKTISTNHPKGIVSANYGAKLISANDTSNFVFRGRFATSGQACTLSYEATQKAHSALTWLAARQGVAVNVGMKDKRTYICWNPNGKKVTSLANPLGLIDDDEPRAYTEQSYKKHLVDALIGYRKTLDDNDDIVVIGLDAATTGRLSVTYYNELNGSDFYDRMQYWGESCNWYFTRFTSEKKPLISVWTPLTKSIVSCAFGIEQKNFLETDDKLLKEQTQRILGCMLDRRIMPYDIVHALTVRASNPQAYSYGNHEKILSTACAVISKYYKDRGVDIKMTLDYENCDRSYLFGRLLAVIEKAERSALADGESREPNAIRLQNAYVNHPMSTWLALEGKLNPYLRRLQPGSRKYYKDLIGEITTKIRDADESKINMPLNEKYLIGYYLQRMELNNGRKSTNELIKEEK